MSLRDAIAHLELIVRFDGLDQVGTIRSKQNEKGRSMFLRFPTRSLPGRFATGAFILHSGLDKWDGPSAQAEGVHAMAAGAFPFLKSIPPERFLKGLAAGEILTGALLLAPFVPNLVAGAALTGFSGSLLAMYARTPALRKPGSIWPSQGGIAVSKDVWMLGIGLGLLADAGRRRGGGSSSAH